RIRNLLLTTLMVGAIASSAHAATKVSFPFTPISAASLPWWIAKESHFYEKYGLDVDMIYVGASPVIIQAMLGGQAGVGAGGGPPLVSNVLQGGDVVQVATTVPYAIQSLIVKPEIRTPADLVGKRIGIEFLIQGLVARKSYAVRNREVVIGMIKATMEGIKQILVNEKQAKAVLAKYTRQTDSDILDQTHKFALDIFVKDPTVTPGSIQP